MKKPIKPHQEKGGTTIGYARVSSSDNRQELGLTVQLDALRFCDKLFIEKESGGNNQRPQLQQALALAKQIAQTGKPTSLVIYKLDRLTRKMVKLLDIIEDLNAHHVQLISLKEQIETHSLTGKLLCVLLGYVAEMELENIRSRTKEGLRKAKEKGIKLGNQGFSEDKEAQIIRHFQASHSTQATAQACQVSRSSVYRVLKRHKIPLKTHKRLTYDINIE